MSDTNTGDQAPADPNAGANGTDKPAETQKPPVFGVVSQYVKDLSFENPRAPQTLGKPLPGNGIKIELNVNSRKMEGDTAGLYEVELKVAARAGEGDETAFALELVYGGVVRVENVPDQNVHPLVTIEGPRLLFPFVRQILADATRNGGYPPLYIDPIDFAQLYRQRLQQQAAAVKQATQSA